MMHMFIFVICIAFLHVTNGITNETEAIEFLQHYDEEAQVETNAYVKASWKYETNITDYNEQQLMYAAERKLHFDSAMTEEAIEYDTSEMSEDTQRQFGFLVYYQLPDHQMQNLTSILSEMSRMYGEGEVCRPNDPEDCLSLEPELTQLMANSWNYSELEWAWEGWRTEVSRPMKPLYEQYVELKNALARENGYTDYGDELRARYETDTFEEDIDRMLEETYHYYEELHTYVRRRLYNVYGDVIDLKGPIPACVLGDMWGRFWNNLYPILEPFPEAGSVDPTPEMIEQNYTVTKMYEMGNDFFTSMGLYSVPDTFFNYSMLEKPDDRQVVCHATAWDFYDGEDFRIRMCTEVNFDNFLTVHHELGHIAYFMQYAHQPVLYRDGANDGFHEAIGELIAMSVATPKHLYSIGLMEELLENEEVDLNYLMLQSLSSLSALPFHYVNDKWRWRLYRGEIPKDQWNTEFWNMKEDIVGVKAPVERTDADLDPPSLYHISHDFDMVRYYTRSIMQYQFAETLCEAANHTGPLYRCDFYGSVEAGEKLAAMLQMGISQPWPEAMEALTGQREMLTASLLSYYEPLYEYLQEQNAKNGDGLGWGNSYRSRETVMREHKLRKNRSPRRRTVRRC